MDAPLAMGSPQVVNLVRILDEKFKGQTLIFEPHTPGSPLTNHFLGLKTIDVIRLPTTEHPHLKLDGHIEYLNLINKYLKDIQVEELIICSPFLIPILWTLDESIQNVIYYMLETPAMYSSWIQQSHFLVNQRVKKILYVEKNRYIRDSLEYEFQQIPALLLYNSYFSIEVLLPESNRNNRILNYGTLDNRNSYLNWYEHPNIARYPIDLLGDIQEDFKCTGDIRTFPKVPHTQIQEIVKKYSFVITLWNQHDRRSRYAPSNKFFEAISLGVPVISAPHPQHVEIVEALNCGIIMKDWSLDSLEIAINEALHAINSNKYEQMVSSCMEMKNSVYGARSNAEKLVKFFKESHV
jgi:hypothetical protein